MCVSEFWCILVPFLHAQEFAEKHLVTSSSKEATQNLAHFTLAIDYDGGRGHRVCLVNTSMHAFGASDAEFLSLLIKHKRD